MACWRYTTRRHAGLREWLAAADGRARGAGPRCDRNRGAAIRAVVERAIAEAAAQLEAQADGQARARRRSRRSWPRSMARWPGSTALAARAVGDPRGAGGLRSRQARRSALTARQATLDRRSRPGAVWCGTEATCGRSSTTGAGCSGATSQARPMIEALLAGRVIVTPRLVLAKLASVRRAHPAHDPRDYSGDLLFSGCGVPDGIRTRVLALKGPRPRPLDDGDAGRAVIHPSMRAWLDRFTPGLLSLNYGGVDRLVENAGVRAGLPISRVDSGLAHRCDLPARQLDVLCCSGLMERGDAYR